MNWPDAILLSVSLLIVAVIAIGVTLEVRMLLCWLLGRGRAPGTSVIGLVVVAVFVGAVVWHAVARTDPWTDSPWALPAADYPSVPGYTSSCCSGDAPTNKEMNIGYGLFHRRSYSALHRIPGKGWDQWDSIGKDLPHGVIGNGATFADAVSLYPTAADARRAFADLDPSLGWQRGPGDGRNGLSVRTVTRVIDHDSYGMLNALQRGSVMIEQWCLVQDLKLRPALENITLAYCARERSDLERELLAHG